jgi:hypothetical protein
MVPAHSNGAHPASSGCEGHDRPSRSIPARNGTRLGGEPRAVAAPTGVTVRSAETTRLGYR